MEDFSDVREDKKTMRNNIFLFGHGGSGNHGCEAIVRSTLRILSETLSLKDCILLSNKTDQEKRYGIDGLCSIEDIGRRPKNLDYFRSYINMKLNGNYEDFDTYPMRSVIRKYKGKALALSIGGDNYCYGKNSVLAYQNKLFNDADIKTVLWGCSIEESVLDNSNDKEDLLRYSYIIARESLTHDLLLAHGFKKVALCPDSAFALPVKDLNLPFDNVVGINLSPWVMTCEEKEGVTYQNFISLIDFILSKTDLNIALIPHVVWNHSDDRIPLQKLFEKYSSTIRIVLIEDQNAESLKGVISKCRYMIAARTHASIAAYSTCVPTWVVGYSVKAKGIAKDIFGTYDNYVLPVQQLSSPHELMKGFEWLMKNEDSIRRHLEEFMPGYIKRIWDAGLILQEI